MLNIFIVFTLECIVSLQKTFFKHVHLAPIYIYKTVKTWRSRLRKKSVLCKRPLSGQF